MVLGGLNGTLTMPGPVGLGEGSVTGRDAGGSVGAGLAGREVTGTGVTVREAGGCAGGTFNPWKIPSAITLTSARAWSVQLA